LEKEKEKEKENIFWKFIKIIIYNFLEKEKVVK